MEVPLSCEPQTFIDQSGNIVQGNISQGSGKIEHTCSVEVQNNSGFSHPPCL